MKNNLLMEHYLGMGKKDSGGDLPRWFKESIVCWYDIPKQNTTNEELAKNPTIIDYARGEHNMTMMDFPFSGVGGIGEFYTDFNSSSWKYNVDASTINKINSIQIIVVRSKANNAFYYIEKNRIKPQKFKIRVTNLNGNHLYIGSISYKKIDILEDGEYEFNLGNEFYDKFFGIGSVNAFNNQNIKIELLPSSNDMLSLDGKSYLVCDNLPLLDDYTIIAERIWRNITNKDTYLCGKSKNNYQDGAFLFEQDPLRKGTVSFGNYSDIKCDYSKTISWQSSYSYNGQMIVKGNFKDTSNIMTIGATRPSALKAPICFRRILLFNKTLSYDERNWVIDNIIKN